MADKIIPIADGLWNVRGSFKIGGLIEIGTQSSLARLASGRFVILDGYTYSDAVKAEIDALTDGGAAVEAIFNLHPFHTLHVEASAAMFPDARLYGTARHHAKAPELRWEPLKVEDPEFHALYAADFRFSVPRGVAFISDNENLHFSSVLAYHSASRALHVDDTLTWVSLPLIGGLSFHMTLKQVLERRPGAAADFRAWAEELVTLCEDVDHLCTAHMRSLPPPPEEGKRIADQVRKALAKVEGDLKSHAARHG